MREIKFRGWYESEKLKTMVQERVTGDCFRWLNEGQPITIMQYTGLKDKNGTEIYEGDIVATGYSDVNYLVFYDEDRVGYSPFARDDGCGCCSDELISMPETCEVIGNKHQHPELLNN